MCADGFRFVLQTDRSAKLARAISTVIHHKIVENDKETDNEQQDLPTMSSWWPRRNNNNDNDGDRNMGGDGDGKPPASLTVKVRNLSGEQKEILRIVRGVLDLDEDSEVDSEEMRRIVLAGSRTMTLTMAAPPGLTAGAASTAAGAATQIVSHSGSPQSGTSSVSSPPTVTRVSSGAPSLAAASSTKRLRIDMSDVLCNGMKGLPDLDDLSPQGLRHFQNGGMIHDARAAPGRGATTGLSRSSDPLAITDIRGHMVTTWTSKGTTRNGKPKKNQRMLFHFIESTGPVAMTEFIGVLDGHLKGEKIQSHPTEAQIALAWERCIAAWCGKNDPLRCHDSAPDRRSGLPKFDLIKAPGSTVCAPFEQDVSRHRQTLESGLESPFLRDGSKWLFVFV